MQSRIMSLIEAWSNTAVAFIISTLVNQWMLQTFFDLPVAVWQSSLMVLVFTLISVVRNYYWRRFFNWLEFHGGIERIKSWKTKLMS